MDEFKFKVGDLALATDLKNWKDYNGSVGRITSVSMDANQVSWIPLVINDNNKRVLTRGKFGITGINSYKLKKI